MCISLNKAVQGLFILVRDLLHLDENTSMAIGRTNKKIAEFKSLFIVVDSLGAEQRVGRMQNYQAETESMNYQQQFIASCTIDFYGDNAYKKAYEFSCLLQSQYSTDIQNKLGLSVYYVSDITDIKKLLGEQYTNRVQQYTNRVQLQLKVQYSISASIETLPIQTLNLNTIIKD